MAIDIAGTFQSGLLGSGAGYSYVWPFNPANADGKIDTVNVSVCVGGVSNLSLGVAPMGSAPNFTYRDWVDLGNLTEGDHSISGADLDVITGDCMGYYNSGGNIQYTFSTSPLAGYAHFYYCAGNCMDGVSRTFTYDGTYYYIFGFGGTGTETAAGGQPLKNVFGRPFRGCFR